MGNWFDPYENGISRWKILNKSWRRGMLWQKRWTTIEAGKTFSNEIMQAQMWYGATGQGKKTFNHTECWEVVKNCKRFRIIPTGPMVVLNKTSLHDSSASDSPMDSPMSQDSPIEKEPRPIGRKAAKAKRGSNFTKNASKFLEEILKHQAMRIEMDMKTEEHDMATQLEYVKEREYIRKEKEYVRQENIEKKDRETMTMDSSHMSHETKQFWKLEQRDVMRRRLFREDGPSNTDWLNDQNR